VEGWGLSELNREDHVWWAAAQTNEFRAPTEQWQNCARFVPLSNHPPPPISVKKCFSFIGIEDAIRCKRLNLMKLFADMP